jgi:aspartyl-tRNA(Asn)/glutamyl-tRNA(Gln) amidotransferase subunit A
MPLSFSLDHPGPMARTVADCARLLGAIAGHDPMDATTSRRSVPDYESNLDKGVRGLRMAVPDNYFYDPVDPEVARIMEQSLNVYRSLGVRLVPVTIPSIEIANPMVNIIISVEGATIHGNWLRTRSDEYGAQTLDRLLPGLLYPATTYLEALNLAQKVLVDFSRAVFDRADLLHVPTLISPVPTIEQTDPESNPAFMDYVISFGHCIRPFNYLRLPALSIPAGFTASGLPTAFQLVGRPYDESLLFRAARVYEREVPWASMSPIPA